VRVLIPVVAAAVAGEIQDEDLGPRFDEPLDLASEVRDDAVAEQVVEVPLALLLA
jgi:hypothetical protein